MNINPWGNRTTTNNGHVVGGQEQATIYWATNLSLDSYRRGWWLAGGGHLFPCDCPLSGYGPPEHRIDDIEFRHENKANFIPTQGVGGQAQNMANRGLVDYPTPSFGDSVFPGGDALQWQLYESLNGYWQGSVP